MKITVIAKPNSKKESVVQNEDGSLTVRFNIPPVDGKANLKIIELLSIHFKVAKSAVQILHGSTSKKKLFKISL
jgi:uncharacterized protein